MSNTLVSIGSASNDKITAMLVNAVLSDNHADAKMAQDVIKARGSMEKVPEYTAAVTKIASGLTGGKVRDTSNDVGIA